MENKIIENKNGKKVSFESPQTTVAKEDCDSDDEKERDYFVVPVLEEWQLEQVKTKYGLYSKKDICENVSYMVTFVGWLGALAFFIYVIIKIFSHA